MRAWLLVCAALALAPEPTTATAAHPSRSPNRDEHIKTQILAKLGLSSRPTPLRAPPRDVVRKILQRAADPAPAPQQHDHAMREIIAIAHRGLGNKFESRRCGGGLELNKIRFAAERERDKNKLRFDLPKNKASMKAVIYPKNKTIHN